MDSDLTNQLFRPRGDPFAGHARYQRVKSALTLIGFGKSKLYSLIRQGRIRAVKLDGASFVDMYSVAALFAACPEIAPLSINTVTAEQLGLRTEKLQPEHLPAAERLLPDVRLTADAFALRED
ncbi:MULTISPECIES: hypothetical protein [unclassified Bradyrhizobium]|uniref:hypothetical protein n=1 Tax=unclassified Bradyrhizobium TaxID=2631580 RepID=UPI001BAD2A9B|nr:MULTISPECIES: hypothetical protein [unclassified Bradyrhizobium]MBR1208767.1 hypothetical protein [Bradyrhizobium sp. AUGA SZCCT0124]MBR1316960.1 hypothetical protein [Bradyrhizobium sp. AUGA SZCCT0051]MBR1345244.1 hypothetical protein [Bradyrhizobium sp. AUGA SZCCT0105]MBR1360054.1 hypothetical protein [Bradyrhizobium sp. AUGA SZCCT0045]